MSQCVPGAKLRVNQMPSVPEEMRVGVVRTRSWPGPGGSRGSEMSSTCCLPVKRRVWRVMGGRRQGRRKKAEG